MDPYTSTSDGFNPYAILPALDTLTVLWPVLVTLGLLCGIAGALIAQHKGETAWKWYVVCAIFGLVGLSLLSVLPRRTTAVPARDTASRRVLRRAGD